MLSFKEFNKLPVLDNIIVHNENGDIELHEGRKWVSGRFDRNIGIDQPAHGVGQTHAHIYGRKGNEIGVVNIDGSASHGTKARLSTDDADALRARGWQIPSSNIVEWVIMDSPIQFLVENGPN